MANLSRLVEAKVEFQWDGSSWTDETANLVSVSGAYEYFPPGESYQSGKSIIQQATVVLDNKSFRYSSWHPSSILYAYRTQGGAYHRRCRIQVRIDNGSWQTLFVGFIKQPDDAYARGQVVFRVWDIGEMLRDKHSTPVLENLYEHQLVIHYLNNVAGLSDGVDYRSPALAASQGLPATIDASTQQIRYSWLDDESIWDELSDIAQASGSRLFVDQAGMIHFEKGWHWTLLAGQSSETLSEDQWQDFEPVHDDKAFYDEVVVTYVSRIPGDSQAAVWELREPKLIPPQTIETITARFQYPARAISYPLPNDDYFLQFLDGRDATASGEVVAEFEMYGQQAIISIHNTFSQPLVFSKAKIVGTPLLGAPSEQAKRTTGSGFRRTLEVRNNPYMQSKVQADSVASFLAWWYEKSKFTYRLTGVAGKPTRKLGNRVVVKADGVTLDGLIIRLQWGITVRERTFAYIQDMTMVENVFPSDYFIVGTSTLGGGRVLWH